ncbi:hypothetical protein SKAU_G00112300 [Synaphobranchus kaupii]|uniref:Uncharacterized protein n=1 Tax=Synaphobranchus kaupii TaxID=118154 RepID=A0A9Q1G0Y7_SYNKA|nr:hypothetical protein SKAU_G00112300 [Synaphobranchus kaupii]
MAARGQPCSELPAVFLKEKHREALSGARGGPAQGPDSRLPVAFNSATEAITPHHAHALSSSLDQHQNQNQSDQSRSIKKPHSHNAGSFR